MNFSTPQSAGSQGSPSSGSVFVSPGTRRQPLSASGTPVLQNCPQNDDERERKQRRRSRVYDLQFSTESPLSIQSPACKQAETSLPAIPQLSNAQIADHYSTCIKLSTENKITTKNVFGLHLIDYMTEILKQKDSELTNFKVAAGTLDASAKIYAVRVDAVHADVYRVLGGLGRDAAPAETENSQDTGGEKEDLDHSKKRSIKRKHLYKTIEKNLNNINVSETERKSFLVEDVSNSSGFLKQAATVLSKSTLQSQNKKSNTLPKDFHYDPDNLTRLFLKPQIRLSNMPLQGRSPSHNDDDEVGEYDYNNPNDTSNFCPVAQDADSDDDDDNGPVNFIGQGGMFEMTAYPTGGDDHDGELGDGKARGFNISTYGEANMVAEPQKVNKIDIQYAKTAKKMDMKRLKHSMWQLLTEVPKNQAEEEVHVRKSGVVCLFVCLFLSLFSPLVS
ncbi:PREDICTED: condensin complex subunit 2-like [Thamnophis sirtalis]|uniref:Condensin complex subunit 2 n=1 Tax=Thamnophis sirtalis TaxID=35019 RepID=A0A6I9YGU5_9SAUR|nr:PREDICTED: condensin complex subunit 2-like [Thamnophis sirtalis]